MEASVAYNLLASVSVLIKAKLLLFLLSEVCNYLHSISTKSPTKLNNFKGIVGLDFE